MEINSPLRVFCQSILFGASEARRNENFLADMLLSMREGEDEGGGRKEDAEDVEERKGLSSLLGARQGKLNRED